MRSSRWASVRRLHIKDFCECCGIKGTLLKPLEVHHILPFNKFPHLELEPTNFITVCRTCHLLLAHLGSFKSYNKDIKEDAQVLKSKIELRP